MVGAREKVLYVEDNYENLMLIKRVLQAEGYQVFEAGNVEEGLQRAHETHPDLILVDIHLPGADGLEIATSLRADPQFAQTPIIAITANVLDRERERSLRAGCNGFIQKPIDVDGLPALIAGFLEQA
jgi:CheY-like chemotaxis protein